MTPFQTLFGYVLPSRDMIHIDSTIVVAMDKLIQRRVNMDRMLKNQLEGTRNMMKHMANRNRPKYEFTERD
jgi:hypothetical protein